MRTRVITFYECYKSCWVPGSAPVLLLCTVGFFSGCVYADDPVDPYLITVPQPSIFDSLDHSRDFLSEKIVNYSQRIDHFFGDKRYFQEHNNSIIQVEVSTNMEEGGNVTTSLNGIAKLDLPAATKRFQLVLESDAEKNTTGEINKDQPVVTNKAISAKKLAASLRYEVPEEEHWHFSSETGVNVQFPLDPFARLRGRYATPLDEWRMTLAETVFWFSTIGLGQTTQLDMERIISPPLLFRATSTVTCYESPQSCGLRQDLSTFQTLNERTALIYQASVLGADKPQLETTNYLLLLRYRYRVHKDWIFVEVSPQLNFPRTDEFRLNALLFLRLEMIFGGYSKF